MSLRAADEDRVFSKLIMRVRNGKDRLALFYHKGRLITRTKRSFGSRKIDGTVRHLIRQQLKLSEAEFSGMVDCSLGREDYVNILRKKKKIHMSEAKGTTQKMVKNERTQRLKERLLHTRPEVESERARLLTQSYRETEGQPTVIRRALALQKILEEMSISIREDELIVGHRSNKPRSGPQFPEMSIEWIIKELDRFEIRPVDRFLTSNEVKKELREILPWWKGKTVCDCAWHNIPEDTKHLIGSHIFVIDNNLLNGLGHILPNYQKAINLGFRTLKEQALSHLGRLEYLSGDDFEKRHFWKAVITVLEAAITFAHRYADLAGKLADREEDPWRKKELREISRICRRVPAHPASSFREAAQFFWFLQCICFIESDGMSISPGRFDQYMYPYYQKDLQRGILTRGEAREILECLWVKFSELVELFPEDWAYTASGFPMGQNLIVGGQTPDGQDATNELSYLCLEAGARMQLPQPNLSVRLHQNSPLKFRQKAAEVIRLGYGQPACFNDEIIIPALLRRGIPLKDARDYAVVGCVEIAVSGKTEAYSNPANLNLPRVLEITLNNGQDVFSQEKIGLSTGDPRQFRTFEQLWDAFRKQMELFVYHMVVASNAIERAHAELVPTPFLSVLISDCLEKGKDVIDGGAVYNFSSPQGIGIANVTDSLAVIKKLVFEEKKITMVELLEVLKVNFQGQEKLRQILINKVPKYGNDDDYVDSLARRVSVLYGKEVEKYHNPRGGQFQPGLYSVSINVPMGKHVGATPDGRKAHTPISDGVSPVHGLDVHGPTATCKSVSKLKHILFSNGTLLNLKFHPENLGSSEGMIKLVFLIESFFNLGGMHIQFNVVSADTLRKAQKYPEKYRSLVVRVAGYSAYFTELYQDLQDDIIVRTEHRL